MGWFWDSIDRAIHRGARRGVEKAVDAFIASGELDRIIREMLAEPKFAWFWFIKEMQWRMMEVDKTLSGKRAWQLAIAAYRQHLEDEEIEFGDPRFSWDRDGARELIEAYEIEHWDAA